MFTKLSSVVASLLLLAAAEGSAAAGTIAVFGDHAGRHNLAAELTKQGHTVSDASRLPDNLDAFDSVWHVGSIKPLTDAEHKRMTEFVGTGGGLYLTGEALGAESMNASVASLIADLVKVSGVDLYTAPEAGSETHKFNVAAPDALTLHPNKLSTWRPGMAGTLEGVTDRNVVARGPDGSVSAAAWRHSELVSGGQLIVVMDAGWLSIDGNRGEIAENFVAFLERQPPWGGTVPEVAPIEPEPASDSAPSDDVDTGGVDPINDGGDDDGDDVDVESAGCSAGGSAGGGAVLGLLAVSLLATRRRRRA